MPELFDQAFKLSNDEDPVGTFQYILGVRLGKDARIEVVDRELNIERQHADHFYRVRWSAGECIHLAEAYTRYDAKWPQSLMDHAVLAQMKYRQTVAAHLLLFQRRGTPRGVKDKVLVDAGGLVQKLKVNVVRLWERPGKPVLTARRPALYPWIALMDATAAEQTEAARRIRATGRKGLAMRMALFGALRYGSYEAFFERIGRMVTKELLQESPLWKEIEEKGKGEGISLGRLEGLKNGLLLNLRTRFAVIPEWAELRIQNATAADVERWWVSSISADSIDSVLNG